MSEEKKPSRVRAVFRNAVVWGVSWGVLGSAIAAVVRLTDNIPFPLWLLDGIGMGIRIGVVGALTGAAFATFVGLAYRGKRLAEISWKRFGIGGAILAGSFVPAWMQTVSLLSGGGLVPFNLINTDIVIATVFGGITAAGTILLAQRDEARNPTPPDELADRFEQQAMVGSGSASEYSTAQQRSRAPEHLE